MERKYLNDLIKRKKDKHRKPLIVWGARQVGKTVLIRDYFASKYYKNKFIYIDLKKETEISDSLQNTVDAKKILEFLEMNKELKIDKNTLIIFDEAQECPSIITSLKYFKEDFREIPVIVTGSMVRMKINRINKRNKQFFFPVGCINEITMYQLNFEEFLMNINKNLYEFLINSYKNKTEISNTYHKMLLKYFYDYLLIGGMPEALNTFINEKNYFNAISELKGIYSDYLDDMNLYNVGNETILRTKKIFNSIYKELNKESKNFSPSLIGENLRNRDLQKPLDWLENTFLVSRCKCLKEVVTLPLIEDDNNLFRLYLNDVGLFSYQSEINATSFILENKKNTLSGIFFENYVATELINAGFPLYYWKGKSDAEFEFIIVDENYVIPIDVKKRKGKLNSLEKFKNHNKYSYAVKISSLKYNFDENNKVLNIPFYDVFLYLKEVKERNNIEYALNKIKDEFEK